MDQTKPDCRCTWTDLRDLSILPHGWVMIRREGPDLESFCIKYLGEGFDPLAKVDQLEASNADLLEACRYARDMSNNAHVRASLEQAIRKAGEQS